MTRIGRPPSCECGTCSKCKHRLYMRKWYQRMTPDERRAWIDRRDPVKVRASDQRRFQRDKTKRSAYNRDYIARDDPAKAQARAAVARALRSGRLQRMRCQVCGARRVHGHHPDYSQPLQVEWLCPFHHKERHRVVGLIRSALSATDPATSGLSDGHAT